MSAAITVTGRRVSISPMTGQHEKIVLAGTRSKTESLEMSRRLITQLVEPWPKWEDLTIGEEFDLLYLIRLYSLRNLAPFSMKCPTQGCGKREDYRVDIRKFKRKLYQCGDSTCPCHDLDIFEYDPVRFCEEAEDPKATVDFSKIPEDHLTKSPPNLTFTTEEGQNSVTCRFALAKHKNEVANWITSQSIDVIDNALSKMVVEIDGEKDEKAIKTAINRMSSYDRYSLRDFVAEREGGVDNDVNITCTHCGTEVQSSIPMDASFFLPRRIR